MAPDVVQVAPGGGLVVPVHIPGKFLADDLLFDVIPGSGTVPITGVFDGAPICMLGIVRWCGCITCGNM